ncbi:hypothetical protein [Citrobacter amalonaticus]|uniref:hypothetical protein n=1 Tax=Citrobacter amalonaticus TaxID=35703 RepID=UPI0019031CC3|nr:hypothetical protein [Citrobacter amalonaticus]MBJ9866306.1 hypothetical protein [Citrobacter amalonaticus]
MDESRKAFEQWWEEWFGEAPLTPWDELWCGDGYSAEDIDHMWDAWKGSRSAIEIKAPRFISSGEALAKGYTGDYSFGFGDAMDAYEESIRAAGIKVKE